MAEAVALQVVVGDLDDAFGAERLPRQVLAAVPAAGGARQALARRVGGAGRGPLGPLAPRVASSAPSRSGASSSISAARRSHVNDEVMPTWWSAPSSSYRPEQQRADVRAGAVLVPAEAGHHAVGRALVLDLEHRPLARPVRRRRGAWRSRRRGRRPRSGRTSPRQGAVARRRRQVDGRRRAAAGCLQPRPPLALGHVAQVLVAQRQQVPGHERGRRLARPASAPGMRPGGCAAAAPRSRAPPSRRDHDLAVQHAALGQLRPERVGELREVAVERLEVAALG